MDEDVQMNAPPPAVGIAAKRRSNVPRSAPRSADPHAGHAHTMAASQTKTPWWQTIMKFMGLLMLVPMFFNIPLALGWVGNLVYNRERYLAVPWTAYVGILIYAFFFNKRAKHTWKSFTTQLMIYGIFALGIYTLTDIPRFLEPKLRQVCLYVWLTLTFFVYAAFLLYDDTDYVEQQRREEAEEEKQRKKDEKIRKELEAERGSLSKTMSPTTKKIINSIIYAILLGMLIYFGYTMWNKYHNINRGSKYDDEIKMSSFDDDVPDYN